MWGMKEVITFQYCIMRVRAMEWRRGTWVVRDHCMGLGQAWSQAVLFMSVWEGSMSGGRGGKGSMRSIKPGQFSDTAMLSPELWMCIYTAFARRLFTSVKLYRQRVDTRSFGGGGTVRLLAEKALHKSRGAFETLLLTLLVSSLYDVWCLVGPHASGL